MGTSSVRSALAFSFAERYSAQALNFLVVIILARLLTPEETGIYSVAVAVAGIAHRFRDFGVGAYLIQARELTDERLRTTFTVSLTVAAAVAAVLFLSRNWVAAVYGEPQLSTLLAILTCNFLVIPFGGISFTLLRRELNFRATACLSLASGIVYASIAVGLGFFGFGPLALAWASLAGAATTSLGATWFRPLWRGYLPSLAKWREVVSFGGYATIGSFATELNASAPDLIVGRVLGFHPAGILSRATGIVSMFVQIVFNSIAPVALSSLAQRLREGKGVRNEFLFGMEYITALSWPFYLVLAILADPVISVVLGAQWQEATPLLRILCVGAGIAAFGTLNGAVLQAAGQVRTSTAISVATLFIQTFLILSCSMISLAAVAIGMAASNVFSVLLAYRAVKRVTGVGLLEVAASIWKSMLVAGAAGCGAAATWLVPDSDWGALLIGGTAASLAWVGAVMTVRHPLAGELLRLLQTATTIVPRFRESTASTNHIDLPLRK